MIVTGRKFSWSTRRMLVPVTVNAPIVTVVSPDRDVTGVGTVWAETPAAMIAINRQLARRKTEDRLGVRGEAMDAGNRESKSDAEERSARTASATRASR